MAAKQYLHSDLAIPPGEFLLEVIEDLGMSQADLARRMGRPTQAINEIIKGAKAITSETALQLEQVTGVPAHIWMGLEDEYQLTKARGQEREQLEQESDLVDPALYNAMAKCGWVRKVRDKVEKVRELWRFFGVASLHNLPEIRTYGSAFRVSTAGEVSTYALAAWLRKGELEAAEIDVQPFSEEKLRALLPELRKLTAEDPQMWLPSLRERLAECGVALVILPHLPKTRAQGATFWVSPNKVVVLMTLRGSWADIFWFSLFHELGHVLLHGKRQVFVEDGVSGDPAVRELEEQANAFAKDMLIPPTAYRRFVRKGDFSASAIHAFAREVGIAPSCIVGRLQNDKHLSHNQSNHLRDRYKWS